MTAPTLVFGEAPRGGHPGSAGAAGDDHWVHSEALEQTRRVDLATDDPNGPHDGRRLRVDLGRPAGDVVAPAGRDVAKRRYDGLAGGQAPDGVPHAVARQRGATW